MLTIEKVIFLKSVDIFSSIPEDALVEVASALVHMEVSAGESIFKQGDPGSSMYIISSGKVRLHIGNQTEVELGSKQVFGLLAALDPQPRVVSATSTEESVLYRLDGDTFYDLISENLEIARGVIHVLCDRLRQKS